MMYEEHTYAYIVTLGTAHWYWPLLCVCVCVPERALALAKTFRTLAALGQREARDIYTTVRKFVCTGTTTGGARECERVLHERPRKRAHTQSTRATRAKVEEHGWRRRR